MGVECAKQRDKRPVLRIPERIDIRNWTTDTAKSGIASHPAWPGRLHTRRYRCTSACKGRAERKSGLGRLAPGRFLSSLPRCRKPHIWPCFLRRSRFPSGAESSFMMVREIRPVWTESSRDRKRSSTRKHSHVEGSTARGSMCVRRVISAPRAQLGNRRRLETAISKSSW